MKVIGWRYPIKLMTACWSMIRYSKIELVSPCRSIKIDTSRTTEILSNKLIQNEAGNHINYKQKCNKGSFIVKTYEFFFLV